MGSYRFGTIEVRPAERRVLVSGAPATLGARAFDLLVALNENRERVMSKDELLALVWPGLIVEENNLQVQVSTLRKILGNQSISTLPDGFSGESICAEIRLSADGRFVYGSNRGHDSLAVFARDAATGRLAVVEIVPSGGKHPRNFNLTPDGRWLLSANRDTDNVVVFQVAPETGRLTPATGVTLLFERWGDSSTRVQQTESTRLANSAGPH